MTPERLAEIRKATTQCPRVWDDRGRYLILPKDIRLNGPAAIEQRRELLEYVDELKAGQATGA